MIIHLLARVSHDIDECRGQTMLDNGIHCVLWLCYKSEKHFMSWHTKRFLLERKLIGSRKNGD